MDFFIIQEDFKFLELLLPMLGNPAKAIAFPINYMV